MSYFKYLKLILINWVKLDEFAIIFNSNNSYAYNVDNLIKFVNRGLLVQHNIVTT